MQQVDIASSSLQNICNYLLYFMNMFYPVNSKNKLAKFSVFNAFTCLFVAIVYHLFIYCNIYVGKFRSNKPCFSKVCFILLNL